MTELNDPKNAPKLVLPAGPGTPKESSIQLSIQQRTTYSVSLADIAQSRKTEAIHKEGAAILIWGEPRTGKTIFAGTITQVPYIKRVFWFDLEKGIESLIYNQARCDLSKIIPFNVVDTKEKPRAAETILKSFTASSPQLICQNHGTINCKDCGPDDPKQSFNLASCGWEDAVVIDSGSQLADSVLNMEKKLYTYKDLRKYYFEFTADMGNIMTAIQAARTNIILIAHSLELTDDDGKLIGYYPLVGSGAFSRKVAKYFGYVIYKHIELNKFKQGSDPLYKPKVITGTRTGVAIEAKENATLVDLLCPTT